MDWKSNRGIENHEVVQNQFTAYVKKAVHNTRLRYLANRSRQQWQEISLSDVEEWPNPAPDGIRCVIEYDALRAALRSVREQERQIILMRIIEEKSFTEIAEALNMRYKAVTSMYYRALAKIKAWMEGV